jgi:hypothetical protein
MKQTIRFHSAKNSIALSIDGSWDGVYTTSTALANALAKREVNPDADAFEFSIDVNPLSGFMDVSSSHDFIGNALAILRRLNEQKSTKEERKRLQSYLRKKLDLFSKNPTESNHSRLANALLDYQAFVYPQLEA